METYRHNGDEAGRDHHPNQRRRQYDERPENGFDMYVKNLINKDVIVETSDFNVTTHAGLLVKRDWDPKGYILLDNHQDDSQRIDMWDISSIRPATKLKYNPLYQDQNSLKEASSSTTRSEPPSQSQPEVLTVPASSLFQKPRSAHSHPYRRKPTGGSCPRGPRGWGWGRELKPSNKLNNDNSQPYQQPRFRGGFRGRRGKIQTQNLADLARSQSAASTEYPRSTTPPG